MTKEDKFFMQEAIKLAREGMENNDGGPFGAVVVKDGKIIGRGNNHVTGKHDPTAHAEIEAIRDACRTIGDFQLKDCTIYTSCEPCPMCLGAIYWARPKKFYYAATREDAANIGFDDDFIYKEIGLSIDKRSIPAINISRKEAITVFESWAKKEDKTEY